ncbi:MAG: hypothetical protein ACM3JQ_00730, partial [Candidatus Eiseniibacteriota bacterium]
MKDLNIYKFTIYENDEEYYTLCTPECTNAINEYLKFRKRYGEKIDPDSPLIRYEFNTHLPYPDSGILPKAQHVSSQAIQWLIT